MLILLKIVLFAILKKVLIIFMINIENVKRVLLKEFEIDIMIKNEKYHNNVKINVHVLKT